MKKKFFHVILMLSLIITGILLMNHLLFPKLELQCYCRDHADAYDVCETFCGWYDLECLWAVAEPGSGTCAGNYCDTFWMLYCSNFKTRTKYLGRTYCWQDCNYI